MKKYILLGFAIMSIVIGFTSTPEAQAKGTAAAVATTSGPCATEFFVDSENITYPLVYGVDANGVDRKGVAMNMKMIGGVPTLASVCLEPGWTVQAKSSTDGVQAALFFNGIKSIDFKYVLGKTDIRFY